MDAFRWPVQDDRLWGLSGGAAKKQVHKTAGELYELARAGRDRLNDEGSGHRPGAFDSLDIDGDWRIANILAIDEDGCALGLSIDLHWPQLSFRRRRSRDCFCF